MLRNLPIERKLTLVILTTCAGVLLMACASLTVFDVIDQRKTLVRNMTVIADVIGENTQAALTFLDDASARATLAALQAEDYVMTACLYGDDKQLFAGYERRAAETPCADVAAEDGHLFAAGSLFVQRAVRLNEKRIGTIVVRASQNGIHERLALFGSTALGVLLAALALAYFLSARLKRPIVRPILGLANTAREIAEGNDFSLRAVKQGDDEIGRLTDAFNQMLAGIEDRDSALRDEVDVRIEAENRARGQLVHLQLLHQITRGIGDRLDLSSMFQVVASSLQSEMPVEFSCACLHDEGAGTLVVSSLGQDSVALAERLGVLDRSPISTADNQLAHCMQGQLVYEPDLEQLSLPLPRALAAAGQRSLVIAPLMVESHCFGALLVSRSKTGAFSSPECEFLQQLSGHVALAVQHAKLYGDLQQAYDDLRQTQQAVMQQERLRALGQMASGIAHDINNAISPVALYTESLLETETTLSEKARRYLVTIQRAVEDVAHTVSRMREFYRQRETQLTLTPVVLNQLVEQVVDLTRARWSDMAQHRGVVIDLRRELAAELPPIMAVESEIREALTNLIFNGVDAMPNGGVLSLCTRVLPASEDDDTQQRVAVEVIDAGIGMDEETRRRCLEPFFTTKGERGTGLGMAMVYGTIKRHSAGIEIDSELGRGTTVRLIFAAAGGVVDDAEKDLRPTMPDSTRLLLVDDDPLLIASLRDTLEQDGHDVTTAHGGQEGIDTFAAAKRAGRDFAIVITDLGMPHVDGRRVSEAVKTLSPATPVIMLTGWGQRIVAEGDVPPHVDLVLNKPPKLRELRAALARLCPPAVLLEGVGS